MPATVRRHVVVRGFVQGVGYRDHVVRAATRHGVAGWVRNRMDGAVEAVLEGPEDAVAEVVAACRRGPQLAAVGTFEVVEQPPEGLDGFDVLPTSWG